MYKQKNKAQISQTFTFLMAAVVIGVILLFGGYSVIKLMGNVQTIEDVKFRQNIDSKINSVSSKYGSVEVFDLTGLRGYSKVCVFDLEKKDSLIGDWNNLVLSGLPDSSLMKGEITDETNNLFLLKQDIQERFLNDKIRVLNDKNFVCANVSSQGVVRVRLEGLGREVAFSFVE